MSDYVSIKKSPAGKYSGQIPKDPFGKIPLMDMTRFREPGLSPRDGELDDLIINFYHWLEKFMGQGGDAGSSGPGFMAYGLRILSHLRGLLGIGGLAGVLISVLAILAAAEKERDTYGIGIITARLMELSKLTGSPLTDPGI